MKKLTIIISLAIIAGTGLYAQVPADNPEALGESNTSTQTQQPSTNENADPQKSSEDNLKQVKALFSQIRIKTYNTSTEDLYKFEYLVKELDAPKDIRGMASRLPKIANAIKTPPIGKSSKGVPNECFKTPKCPTCNGSGKHTTNKMESKKCPDCKGNGLKRKLIKTRVENGKTINTYTAADPTFDQTSAKEVFKDYLNKISAWLSMQQ